MRCQFGNTIFETIHVFGKIDWALFSGLLLSGYLFKVLVAACDTPFMYLGVALFRKRFKMGQHQEIDLNYS